MSMETIEHAAKVLKEIKAEVKSGVIKDYEVPVYCYMGDKRETLLPVVLKLSTKYYYHRTILETWCKRLEAEDYMISVSRNQLIITFYVMYRK